MKLINPKFITSFADAALYKESRKNETEVCFVGRSNVGKSTFINTLLGAKLAKTSSLPGRTRLINLFEATLIEPQNQKELTFTLTDLPGYGYNKASKADSEKWGQLIEAYLSVSEVKLVFLLVDSRVKSPLDVQMTEYLYYYRIPFCVLLSKCDKLPKTQLSKNIMEASSFLKIGRDNIIPVDDSGLGRDVVRQKIFNLKNISDVQADLPIEAE